MAALASSLVRMSRKLPILYRELGPHVLGHKHGQETVLTYQFAGQTASSRLVANGAVSSCRRSRAPNSATAPGTRVLTPGRQPASTSSMSRSTAQPPRPSPDAYVGDRVARRFGRD